MSAAAKNIPSNASDSLAGELPVHARPRAAAGGGDTGTAAPRACGCPTGTWGCAWGHGGTPGRAGQGSSRGCPRRARGGAVPHHPRDPWRGVCREGVRPPRMGAPQDMGAHQEMYTSLRRLQSPKMGAAPWR